MRDLAQKNPMQTSRWDTTRRQATDRNPTCTSSNGPDCKKFVIFHCRLESRHWRSHRPL